MRHFRSNDHRPSRYLARLGRIVAALGVRGNPLVWFALNAVVPWDLFFTHQLDLAKRPSLRVPRRGWTSGLSWRH